VVSDAMRPGLDSPWRLRAISVRLSRPPHRMGDDMDCTGRVGLMDCFREHACPTFAGPGRWHQWKQRRVPACLREMGVEPAEVLDPEHLLRDQEAACEYQVHIDGARCLTEKLLHLMNRL
jgi:hypothetical protein